MQQCLPIVMGVVVLCAVIVNRKAVMAILTHPVHGDHALNYCTGTNETPMRLLVINMTGKYDLWFWYADTPSV